MRLVALAGVLLALGAILVNYSNSQPVRVSAVSAVQGDVTCDGSVDAIDALQVVQFAGGIASDAACLQTLGNVDCGPGVDMADAARILRFAAGLSSPPISGCLAVGDSSPTTEELIDAAEADGDIDHGTALLYKVYAAFQDDRLPEQYKGAPASEPGELPDELSIQPPDLSEQVKRLLEPFLRPPAAPDSWYNQSHVAQPLGPTTSGTPINTPPPGAWKSVSAASGKLHVWWDQAYPADQARAELVAAESQRLWDLYSALLGVEPIGDSSVPTFHGPDGIYDTYIGPMKPSILGYVTWYRPGLQSDTGPCEPKPNFQVLNRTLANADLKTTFAHELFHSFQNSVPALDSCEDRRWLDESTATWSEDYAYPAAGSEYYRDGFFVSKGAPIQQWGENSYGAYVFFLYLTRSYSPELMGTIFKATQTEHVFDAIDKNVPGGLTERWTEFALFGFNQSPFNKFVEWNELYHTPVGLNISPNAPGLIEQWDLAAVNPVSVVYFQLIVNKTTKYLTVNDLYEGDSVRLQLLDYDGGWRVHPVEPHGTLGVCLSEDLEASIWLIVANSSPTDVVHEAGDESSIEGVPSCAWNGTTTYTSVLHEEIERQNGKDIIDKSTSYSGSELVFELDLEATGGTSNELTFVLKSGKLHYVTSSDKDVPGHETCGTSGSGNVTLGEGDATLTLTPDGPFLKYTLVGNSDRTLTIHSNCSSDTFQLAVGEWINTGEQTSAIPEELAGTLHDVFDDGTGSRTVHLETDQGWQLQQ